MSHKFVLIGCGRIAQRHAEQIARVGQLLAVCDIVREKAMDTGLKYGAAVYTDIESLLSNELEADIAVICSPNGLHAAHSIRSLQAGKHVLVEKPLSIHMSDALNIQKTASDFNKQVFVVKQNRFNPPVEAVKEMLRQNQLGKISSFQINCFWNRPASYYENTWKGSLQLDGGALYTQFSHFIDLLYWFLGDVKSVQTLARNFHHPYIETDDTGIVVFEMMDGAIGTLQYTTNAYRKNMEGSITLFGEKGTVKIGGQYLNTLEYQQTEEEAIVMPANLGNKANDYGFYQGSMSNHDQVYDHLLKALNNESHQLAGIQDGIKSVAIIESIYQQSNLS